MLFLDPETGFFKRSPPFFVSSDAACPPMEGEKVSQNLFFDAL